MFSLTLPVSLLYSSTSRTMMTEIWKMAAMISNTTKASFLQCVILWPQSHKHIEKGGYHTNPAHNQQPSYHV